MNADVASELRLVELVAYVASFGGMSPAEAEQWLDRACAQWRSGERPEAGRVTVGGMAHTDGEQRNRAGGLGEARRSESTDSGPTNGHWADADWLGCRDGKWRPVEPGTSPLANGSPGRVGRLRAYGNAINSQVAAEMIRAFMEVRP